MNSKSVIQKWEIESNKLKEVISNLNSSTAAYAKLSSKYQQLQKCIMDIRETEEPNSISNKSTPNVMVDEDELADKLRYAILHDFGNLVVTPCVRNCTKIALQYHKSKLEELNKWIEDDFYSKMDESFPRAEYIPEICEAREVFMEKVESLKQES